jgi:phage terminase large subunit-like protein
LEWPNGAVAYAISASEPEALRGPQFDAAWCDELAKWKKAEEVWDMLQFTLRLGDNPRQLVTTTPRNVAVLKRILKASDTVVSTAPTMANKANLAPKYLEKILADYHGTRLGRQEIDGELLEDQQGAFWPARAFDDIRVDAAPAMDRIVVAVDPPASSGKSADECGIVVAGVVQDGAPHEWQAYVLADLSLGSAAPNAWAAKVAEAYEAFGADRVVAEINQGGEMVEAVLRQHAPMIPFRAVHATRGKSKRAEPVAALYEQGRVRHRGLFKELEDQMSQVTAGGYLGPKSPDRVDALVWALTDLMIEPSRHFQRPSVRTI